MATLSIDRPVSPLRQRVLDDMAMHRLGARTQHDYVRHVRAFAGFLGRSPETATAEDVRRFQLHQREHGVGEGTINGTVSALRFLFGVTLERPDLSRRLVLARRPRKLPDVLSVEEVAKLLEAAPGIKYRAALGVAYRAGLRVSEVAHLKADDIDSKRMLIRIEEGKGRKDRNAMLSPSCLNCCGCDGARASGAASCWRTAEKPKVPTPRSVVERLRRLAVPGAQLHRSDLDPAVAPGRVRSCRRCRHPQARQPAYPAAQL